MKAGGARAISVSAVDLGRIAEFGRSVLVDPSTEAVLREAMKVLRRLTPSTGLRVVESTGSTWKEWRAGNGGPRSEVHAGRPEPETGATTCRLGRRSRPDEYVSARPASAVTEWVLDLIAPHIAAALSLEEALRVSRDRAGLDGALARAGLQAREEERRRISNELHDDLGQTVATLKLKLKLVEDRIASLNPAPGGLDEIREVRDGIGSLLGRIREVSHSLYPRILDTLGLIPALDGLAAQVSTPQGIRTRLKVRGKPRPMDPETTVALYRCCQEAVNNVIRHSGASNLTIRVFSSDTRIRVVVEDDGRGLGTDPGNLDQGIADAFWTIRQRMGAVGGSFRVGSNAGRGTRIEMVVPTDKNKKNERQEK